VPGADTPFPCLTRLRTVHAQPTSLSRRLPFASVSNAYEGFEYEYGFHPVCGWIQ